MLAKSIKKKFINDELFCTDVEELDITDFDSVITQVNKIKPEYIINCAAYTDANKAEDNYELANKINNLGVKNLAIASKNVGAVLVHISTDYVFGGDLDLSKNYNETDETYPLNVYGKTKVEGEKEVRKNTDKYYIFRTAWLYGDGKNFVRTMLELASNKEEINVVFDQNGSPTNADDLADIVKQAIDKKIPYGTYHTTNLGFTTWYEFAKKIFELANVPCKVNPVTTEEYIEMTDFKQAKRPKNSKLSKEKILSQGIKISNWEDALKRYLDTELNKN